MVGTPPIASGALLDAYFVIMKEEEKIMSTTEQYPDFSGLTFEKVWAMFKEDRERMKESDLRMDLRMQEIREEMRKSSEKVDKQIDETNKIVGRLGNRFGEAMERLVRPGVADKFNEMGYHFPGESHNLKIKDPKTGNRLTELDIILENGESVIVVEIKVNPCNADIEHLAEQLQHYREFRNRINPNDHKKIFGAIAAAVFPEPVQKVALDFGYYVIVPSGENIKIVVPEKGELKAF
jgi:hypothetical protein